MVSLLRIERRAKPVHYSFAALEGRQGPPSKIPPVKEAHKIQLEWLRSRSEPFSLGQKIRSSAGREDLGALSFDGGGGAALPQQRTRA